MQHVKDAVRAASIRLFIVGFIARFATLITLAIVALFIATLLDRLLGVAINWKLSPWVAFGIAFAAAFIWSIAKRHREIAAARVLDERAGLRESLSTALCVEKNSDSWAKAVVLSAEEKAKKLRVAHAIPIEAPQRWYVPVFAALCVGILWMSLPRYDLLGLLAKRHEAQDHQQEIVQVKAEVKAKEDKLAEMLAKAGVEMKKEGQDDATTGKPPTEVNPDEIRRAAVKKLTDVNDRLNQLQSGERQQQLKSLQDQLKQLKQPGPGPLQELSRNLAKGDFSKAQENLAELQKKLEDSSLSPQEKEQVKAQFDGLAKQLKDQASKQEELKNLMQQAGVDKKTAEQLAKQAAQNPEAVKKALEQMKNMSPEQQKKMIESAMAMSKSMGQCENMSQSMNQMAQSMSKEGMSEAGKQAMQQLSQQMSEMEQMAQEAQALQAAASEAKQQLKEMGGKCEAEGECDGCKNGGDCKGGNCKNAKNGLWREGDTNRNGSGSGGPGRGDGKSPEQLAADYRTEKRKANSNTQGGPIIGTRLVYGEQVRGESAAEFASAVETAKGSAAEALEAMRVPREYQEAVKTYFGTLEKKAVDAAAKPATESGAKPDPKPADSKPEAPKPSGT
ncbi:MAG: hypothetical protein KF691_15270 [Phycisphaeraceae bacterium]|nr:hypothetical protein [Phycisphaeraceae bacterium]